MTKPPWFQGNPKCPQDETDGGTPVAGVEETSTPATPDPPSGGGVVKPGGSPTGVAAPGAATEAPTPPPPCSCLPFLAHPDCPQHGEHANPCTCPPSQIVGSGGDTIDQDADPCCFWHGDEERETPALAMQTCVNCQRAVSAEHWDRASAHCLRCLWGDPRAIDFDAQRDPRNEFGGWADAEDAVAPSPLALHRERLIETMIQHQRTDIRLCGCGWDQLGDRNVGRSHAVHIADAVLAAATTGVLALHRARIFEVLDEHFDDPPGRDWLPVVDAVLATAVDLEPVVAEITRARQDYISGRLSERLEVQHGIASSHDVQVWTDAARRTWDNRYPALRDIAGGER